MSKSTTAAWLQTRITFTRSDLPDAAVRESRDRVRAAIKNSGYLIPPTHITINLAPADLKKEGSGFDLPIAVGILGAYGALQMSDLSHFLLVGELGLTEACARAGHAADGDSGAGEEDSEPDSCRRRMRPRPRSWKA